MNAGEAQICLQHAHGHAKLSSEAGEPLASVLGSVGRGGGTESFFLKEPEKSGEFRTEGGSSRGQRKKLPGPKWKGPEQMSWPQEGTRFQGDESQTRRQRGTKICHGSGMGRRRI